MSTQIHSDLFLFICRSRDSDCKRFKVIHHKCFAILKQTIGLKEFIWDQRHHISLFQLYMLSLAAYGMTNPDLQEPTALESSLAPTIDNILSVSEYNFLVRFNFRFPNLTPVQICILCIIVYLQQDIDEALSILENVPKNDLVLTWEDKCLRKVEKTVSFIQTI